MSAEYSNCFGYALQRLGFIDEDCMVSSELFTEHFIKGFIEVETLEEADALAARLVFGGEKAPFFHLAVVDKEDREFVYQRRQKWAGVERVDQETAFGRYVDKKGVLEDVGFEFEIVYLKIAA